MQPVKLHRVVPAIQRSRAAHFSAGAENTTSASTGRDDERHSAPSRRFRATHRGSGVCASTPRNRASSCGATMSTRTSERATTTSTLPLVPHAFIPEHGKKVQHCRQLLVRPDESSEHRSALDPCLITLESNVAFSIEYRHGRVAAGGCPPAAPGYGRNMDFSVPPAQIPACPLGHGAPTSGV